MKKMMSKISAALAYLTALNVVSAYPRYLTQFVDRKFTTAEATVTVYNTCK